MLAFNRILLMGLVAAAAGNAAQIQIGATTIVGENVVNRGLTSGWIANPNANGCAGCKTGSTNANGDSSSFLSRNYSTSLFATPASSTTPPNGYQATPSSTVTITDSATNATFALLDDGVGSGGPNNYWAGQSTSIEVPIGVFGVSTVWTMMNDYWGYPGSYNVATFHLGPNQGTISDSVSIVLDGDARIRDAVACSAAGPTISLPPSPGGTADCTSYYQGNGQPSTLWTGTYTDSQLATASSPYLGTSGALNLDAQTFNFGQLSPFASLAPNYLSQWLVSITFTNVNGGASVSKLALSAITVDAANASGSQEQLTPEPGTVFLLLGGLSAIGFGRMRRNRA